MIFETAKDLKAFLVWAKKEKMTRVRVGEVEVEFSALAFVPESNLEKEWKELREDQEDFEDTLFFSGAPDPKKKPSPSKKRKR